MAIVLYAPALALSQSEYIYYLIISNSIRILFSATGLNIWLSVVSIGVICTFYSSVVCCSIEDISQISRMRVCNF